jgi:threonine/homoserine/homoserine lactone efflux protein
MDDHLYFSGLIFLVAQHILGLLSIGPCTALVIRNSLYNRWVGLRTVFGATLGSFSIKSLSVCGLALLMTHNPNLFEVFKVAGGGYLVLLGIQSLVRAYKEFHSRLVIGSMTYKGSPFISGYLMSLSNPMSSIRFIALFATVVNVDTPVLVQFSYLIALAVISLIFYGLMALFFSTQAIQETMNKYRYGLSAFLGGTLIYWGVKILQVSF